MTGLGWLLFAFLAASGATAQTVSGDARSALEALMQTGTAPRAPTTAPVFDSLSSVRINRQGDIVELEEIATGDRIKGSARLPTSTLVSLISFGGAARYRSSSRKSAAAFPPEAMRSTARN